MRWWAEAGLGGIDHDPGPPQRPPIAGDRRAGAAIAKINGVRYVFVPGNFAVEAPSTCRQARLRIFRFHPCNGGNETPQTPTVPIAEIVVTDPPCFDPTQTELICSTPLILNRTIGEQAKTLAIVQTTQRVYCFDVTALPGPAPCAPVALPALPVWTFPSDENIIQSDASSVAAGAVDVGPNSPVRLFVHSVISDLEPPFSKAKIFCLDPDTGVLYWSTSPRLAAPDASSTPAIGPLENDSRNIVYVSMYTTEPAQQLQGVLADGTGCRQFATISTCDPTTFFPFGSYGSPSIHDSAGAGNGDFVGVGDCNNDGSFDFFDIDCFVASAAEGRCSEGYGSQGGGDGLSGDGGSQADRNGSGDHFTEVIAALRAHFGVE